MASVLGVMKNPQQTVAAIGSLKGAGFGDLEVFSPIPSHAIEEAFDSRPSRVRAWTLIGGLTGVTLGYLMIPLTAGLLLGRSLARLLVRALLPPRLRYSLALLWTTDGLELPPDRRGSA